MFDICNINMKRFTIILLKLHVTYLKIFSYCHLKSLFLTKFYKFLLIFTVLQFTILLSLQEEETEQEKEVNLDAILESAEMREEEESATGDAANNELLSAFKCTTVQFEETEKELEKKG